MLHRLRELGFTTRMFEAADGVGGAWYWNRYPGARCDSESHYYCYSFSDEVRKEWKWSCRYPAQPEILGYLNFVADRLDLKKDIDFGTRVTAGTFDEDTHDWVVETNGGETVRARFLITAVGNTSAPSKPAIQGLDDFAGKIYYTASWPHEKIDFSGQRVGLIGTGSSGIQCTPHLAAEADRLTVFQRTANYSVPARNHLLTDAMRLEQEEKHQDLRRKTLASPIGMPFDLPQLSALEVSAEDRKRRYDELWAGGGFRFMFTSFNDLTVDLKANDTIAEYIGAKIRDTVRDPATAEVLCDFNHPAGTKRPPIDTDYYETFNRDNVNVVSIRTNPIREIMADGIILQDNERYELDTIVFATGFDAVTGSILNMNLRGKGGEALRDKWDRGPRAYLGLSPAGFPNMFMVTGPGSPSILANFPVCIEQHVDWIAECMVHMRENGIDEIEALPEPEDAWAKMIAEEANKTLLPLANSWYMGANIPGKPRVFLAYPSGVHAYTVICDDVAKRGYEGFALRSRKMAEAVS
ncbi:cyclohexanone monooxygenase [Polymorphobacter glacialis]|uniref:Cyclohexanone monooxygenase n=2 Tax=Sandarakinorhabdus glacialis TaxID=1614636 RepID=A0A916ZZD9_9SPHN|nr:cyclohexanone monooxygenase [Polymorphobacter glacialis]